MRTLSRAAALISMGVLSTLTLAQPARTGVDPIAEANGRVGFDYFDSMSFDERVPSPAAFFGHEIGDRFHHHHEVMGYFDELARTSDRVKVREYGTTHQGRSLRIAVVTSPANHARLDDILSANMRLTDPSIGDGEAQRIIDSNPAIAWFSFNVHGNEASCSEAALMIAYTMAAGSSAPVTGWLDDIVLVIDPMVNPDGRERYVSWYENARGAGADESPDSVEHDEPWPGGRMNHYLFDLNRDWLWLVQPESRARLPMYRRFMPQLHIDYHEQWYDSPYFFGAGDAPYNEHIPDETKQWLEIYGKHNAHTFDRKGLVYSTKERFDYLYPGYGKVLPVYHGAVGMLCEQAGHSAGGTAIRVHERYTLTLRDRARHHYMTAMSYLETTAARRADQLSRFRRFFGESMRVPDGHAGAYIVSADTDPALLKRCWDLCAAHGIEVHALARDTTINGLGRYDSQEPAGEMTIPAGSWVIPAGQRMGRLARAIFERTTQVEDPDTYDITAWSMPVAFGLEAYYADSIPSATERLSDWSPEPARITGQGRVALLVDSGQHDFPRAIGLAMKHDLFARVSEKEFNLEGQSFDAGTLIVHAGRNGSDSVRAFEEELVSIGLSAHRAGSGYPEDGEALGADANRVLTMPRIILLRDEGLDPLSFGQHRHLLDHLTPLPHTVINSDALGRVDLDRYNLMVISSGTPGNSDAIREFVRSGGTVVASGASARWASLILLDLKDEKKDEQTDSKGDERPELSELSWAEREARGVEDRVPGAMLLVHVDTSHPLASGVREWVGLIKRGDSTLPISSSGEAVARFGEAPLIGGSVSDRNLTRFAGSPAMTSHRLGRGRVICIADDPTFRGFNHGATRLLLNAIIYGAR